MKDETLQEAMGKVLVVDDGPGSREVAKALSERGADVIQLPLPPGYAPPMKPEPLKPAEERLPPHVPKNQCAKILRDFFGKRARFQMIRLDDNDIFGCAVRVVVHGGQDIELARVQAKPEVKLGLLEVKELPWMALRMALQGNGFDALRGWDAKGKGVIQIVTTPKPVPTTVEQLPDGSYVAKDAAGNVVATSVDQTTWTPREPKHEPQGPGDGNPVQGDSPSTATTPPDGSAG